MSKEISLSHRAIVALGLTVGFYAMAFVISIGTMALPFIIAYYTGHLVIKLVVVCCVAGGTVLIAMFPRMDKFEPPGPPLTPQENPKLFEVISEIAEKTGQSIPESVYLIPDFNAFVNQRGGTNGFGGSRVMGLGLPLMKETNITQFKAILAHEFGHYYQGDTAFAPRIYQIGAAIERAVAGLQDRQSVLQLPFKWYAKKFLRITSSISRSQEFGADRLAAKIYGKNAVTDALRQIALKGNAFYFYWRNEFLPMIGERRLPPFIAGFELYLSSENARDRASKELQEELEQGETDQYDSHPSLKERLDALGSLDNRNEEINATPAIELIGNPSDLEFALVKSIIKDDIYQRLKPMSWDTDLAAAYISHWEKETKLFPQFLQSLKATAIPDMLENPVGYVKMIDHRRGIDPDEFQYLFRRLQFAASAGLALLLIKEGWVLQTKLGEYPVLSKNDVEINPFAVFIELQEGKRTGEQWIKFCEMAGIGDKNLNSEQKNT